MNVPKLIWKWLNGNKTIIFSILFGLTLQPFVMQYFSAEFLEMMQWLFGILGGASLAHHVSKGYFTTQVGNKDQEANIN